MINNVSELYPTISIVRQIDQLMVQRWGVDFFSDFFDYRARFERMDPKLDRYFKECDRYERRLARGKAADETALFNLLADEEVFAAVGSKRLITAAEAWLFLASQVRRVEAAFPNDEAVTKRRSKDHMKANVAVESA